MIRDACLNDADGIALIYNHYVEKTVVTFEELPVLASEMLQRISAVQEKYPWLVALDEDTVVGYAYASSWRPRTAYRYAVESSVYLHPKHTGKKIGSALYTALLQRLKEAGLHTVLGGIALPNEASIALHEKFGFVKVAHLSQVGFKFGQWVDVGYWQLMLEPT